MPNDFAQGKTGQNRAKYRIYIGHTHIIIMNSNNRTHTPSAFFKSLVLMALTLSLTPVLANTGKAFSIEGAVLLNGVPMN